MTSHVIQYQRPERPSTAGGGRLGQNVRHDPRSKLYRRALASSLKSVAHDRILPVLDQGDVGSCTGNAGTGALGTAPLYGTLPADVASALGEPFALQLYSDATKVDDAPGTYLPDDTGSDGLAIGQVLKARGLISGYTLATSAAEMASLLQSVPVIIGIPWFEGFDSPRASDAMVTISGSMRGGHEVEVDAYDAATDTFTAVNSWSESWGDAGRFRFTGRTMQALFDQAADCYGFVPLDQPAPTPTPVPITSALAAARAVLDPWAAKRHTGANATAASAWKAYSRSQA